MSARPIDPRPELDVILHDPSIDMADDHLPLRKTGVDRDRWYDLVLGGLAEFRGDRQDDRLEDENRFEKRKKNKRNVVEPFGEDQRRSMVLDVIREEDRAEDHRLDRVNVGEEEEDDEEEEEEEDYNRSRPEGLIEDEWESFFSLGGTTTSSLFNHPIGSSSSSSSSKDDLFSIFKTDRPDDPFNSPYPSGSGFGLEPSTTSISPSSSSSSMDVDRFGLTIDEDDGFLFDTHEFGGHDELLDYKLYLA